MKRTDFIAACFNGGCSERAKAALYDTLGSRREVDSKAMEKIDAKLRDALGHRNTDYQSIQRIRLRIRELKRDTWRLMEEACESKG